MFHDGYGLWSYRPRYELEPEVFVEGPRYRQVPYAEAYVVDASNLSQGEVLVDMYEG